VKIISEHSTTHGTCSRSLGQILNHNNSVADCLILLKFDTEFHLVTGDTPPFTSLRYVGI